MFSQINVTSCIFAIRSSKIDVEDGVMIRSFGRDTHVSSFLTETVPAPG